MSILVRAAREVGQNRQVLHSLAHPHGSGVHAQPVLRTGHMEQVELRRSRTEVVQTHMATTI